MCRLLRPRRSLITWPTPSCLTPSATTQPGSCATDSTTWSACTPGNGWPQKRPRLPGEPRWNELCRSISSAHRPRLGSSVCARPSCPARPHPTFPPDAHGELAASYQWLATEHTGLALSLDQAWREGLGRAGTGAHAATRRLLRGVRLLGRVGANARGGSARRPAGGRPARRGVTAARSRRPAPLPKPAAGGGGILHRQQRHLPRVGRHRGRGRQPDRTRPAHTGAEDRLAEAASCFEECLGLCRGLADPDREAKAMLFFAKVRRQQGRFEDALSLLTSSGEMFRSVNSCGYVAYTDLMMGIMYSERGEFDRGRRSSRAGAGLRAVTGRPRWEAYALLNLAVAAQGRGLRGRGAPRPRTIPGHVPASRRPPRNPSCRSTARRPRRSLGASRMRKVR